MSVAQSIPLPPAGQSRAGKIFTPQFTVLIVVAWILVTAEGLTRGSSIAFAGQGDDSAYLSFGSWFAWVTLPFVLLYAKSVRIHLAEALLLWLLLGSVIYDKSFAYTRIPGIPVYVTDVVLAFCCLGLWKKDQLNLRALTRTQWILYGLFFAAGCVAAARGLFGGQDKTKTFRDCALIVYTAFVPVSLSVHRSWTAIKRYLVFGGFAACLASINAFLWFVTTPGMRRYIPSPVYVQSVFVVGVLLKMRGWKGWRSNVLVGLSGLGVLLGNARSTDLIAFVALVVLVSAAAFLWRGVPASFFRTIALTGFVGILLIFAALQTRAGQNFVDRSAGDIASGINFENDDNAAFRFLAWAEAYRRFSENPSFGEGYGIPFVFELADDDPRPHNTYLTVLYKMGLFGFLGLFAIGIDYWKRGLYWLYRLRSFPRSTCLLLLLLIQFSFCAYGVLNLLLESPFLASLFWINVGMTLSVIALLREERLFRSDSTTE
jgi:O-antigen ligase